MDELIAKISNACQNTLPGWEAQKKLINYARPTPQNFSLINPPPRQGGVLALLYPKNHELFTVLMLRNTYEGVHSNQVSFPGGEREKEDASLWHTALREANEEVGLKPEGVVKLGELTKVYIPPSRFLVTPYLAFAEKAPTFIANAYEVKKIIETPISLFLNDANIREKDMFIKTYNTSIPIKYYEVNGAVVWGATAMMLSEMATILNELDLPPYL